MFKIKVFNSKKDPKNKVFALVCDLGYTTKFLTFNIQDIAEIYGVSVKDLHKLEVGDYQIK